MLSFCKCDEQDQEDGTTFPSYRHIYGVIGCIVGTVVGWYFYRKVGHKLKFEGYIDGYLKKLLKKGGSTVRSREELRTRSVNMSYQDSNSQTVQVQASSVLSCDNNQGEHSSRVGNISRKRRRHYV